jgi:nucleoside phosphorylase
MKLLLVASDRMEFSGLIARAGNARRAECGAEWARLVSFGGHEVLLAANGVGTKHAAAAVDSALRYLSADAVGSVGFCGAVEKALKIGDIVTAECVTEYGRSWKAAPVATPVHPGKVCTMEHVVRTSEEKREIRATGACAVDMEAAGVAARAESLGLPFYCIKTVTDLAHEDMANDFNAALREDGHFDTMLILKGTLRHPAARLPELLRLRNRCARAARRLGEFIVDCRF